MFEHITGDGQVHSGNGSLVDNLGNDIVVVADVLVVVVESFVLQENQGDLGNLSSSLGDEFVQLVLEVHILVLLTNLNPIWLLNIDMEFALGLLERAEDFVGVAVVLLGVD